MKPRRLHVPLLLTWTALTAGSVVDSVACSSGSDVMTEQDSSPPMKDGGGHDHHVGDTASEAIADAIGDKKKVECEEVVDGAITYYTPDGDSCPHPECEHITDSSISYFMS